MSILNQVLLERGNPLHKPSLFGAHTQTLVDVFHLGKNDTPEFEKRMAWLPKQISTYGSIVHNAYPLDMSQYQNLFHSTRIPHVGKDELRKTLEEKGRHVVVQVTWP
jgi:hypothetical protein